MPVSGVLVSKRLNYRRATFLQKTKGATLQSKLQKALDTVTTVGARKQVVSDTENTFLLLNSVRVKWKMIFGAMLLYSRGRNQALVTEDDAADELTVEQMAPPPDAKGARRDFVESLLYFAVKDNHVVVLQSQGLRNRHLENHFNWLMQDRTKVIDANDRILIADQPSQVAMAHALTSPVKKVLIGAPLESKSAKSNSATEQLVFSPEGIGFNVLKSILGHDWLKKTKLHDCLDDSRLKVEVLVSYTRATTDSGQDLLNDIAMTMRNQEPDDVVIELKNGGKIRGAELQISGPVSVMTYGGIPDITDLYPRMKEWLLQQLEMGVVQE